ncbi:Uncharacterized conserved protein [Ceraceosorus bombacis]|uniref:COX assembly mitochondrial protein n=1 Tax=Ceraceosorus bombacis TaxID=401625 RepID=A0A0P1BEY0_9BASI|nr:Uncharacterized conserved protein [Ceraceosorus bombacis]
MHPALSASKQEQCGELIRALNDCHAKGFWHKITGGCNDVKLELNKCLRKERLERTARNAEKAANRHQGIRSARFFLV